MLTDFDVRAAARGWRKAYERTFRYLVPDANKQLILRFTAGFAPVDGAQPEAMVQAIEVLPEAGRTMRLNAGATQHFIDWNGNIWDADDPSAGGQCIISSQPVRQATPTLYDQALYQTARAGHELSYSLRMPPGHYTVHLKFAELWLRQPGERPMDIEINGQRVWQAWDPATAAGEVGMAMDLRAEAIVPDRNGLITVTIKATGKNDAISPGDRNHLSQRKRGYKRVNTIKTFFAIGSS